MKTVNSNRDIYGSFSLDGTEVVVEVQYIQEAVNFPEELTKIQQFLMKLFKASVLNFMSDENIFFATSH